MGFDLQPREPTPPTTRPPPPPPGGPSGVQPKIETWKGVASLIQSDLKADAACNRCPWPCLKRWLLGGPPCGDQCKSCKAGDGKGADPCRERASTSLAKLMASKAIAPDLLASIKKGEPSRA